MPDDKSQTVKCVLCGEEFDPDLMGEYLDELVDEGWYCDYCLEDLFPDGIGEEDEL